MGSTFKIWQLACLKGSADTRSGKRHLRPQSGSGFGPYPRTGSPRALRSGPYRLSLSPINAGLPMFLPRRLDFLLALAKGYSLLGSQILESYSRFASSFLE